MGDVSRAVLPDLQIIYNAELTRQHSFDSVFRKGVDECSETLRIRALRDLGPYLRNGKLFPDYMVRCIPSWLQVGRARALAPVILE